ncbi:MAG: selenide, water dikinase SelD [Thiotrichales bacterium]
MFNEIRMTEYSHGSGCGCKISPATLDVILKSSLPAALPDEFLLVGNSSKDDAAVYDLGNGTAVISTTDFFMPIVDDPFDFGRIAATNAISDIYAMGGKPIMAIAIFGWPIDKLPPEVGQKVVDGGRAVCRDAGISLAGGHSIDAPEPIFGLAVTGIVPTAQVKQNNTAKAGNRLYLTKPLGIGVLSTAQKKKLLAAEHQHIAPETMCKLNKIGAELGTLSAVTAMTDVTGFGLAGHLCEVCEGSGLQAVLDFGAIPLLPHVHEYLDKGCAPGGTARNFASYGHKLGELCARQKEILCDPQTSGGLLLAVDEQGEAAVLKVLRDAGYDLRPIGYLTEKVADVWVNVE